MKKYESYTPTQLDWLSEIPSHWQWNFLSQIASEQKTKKGKTDIHPVLSLSYGRIVRKRDIDVGLVPASYDNYQVVNRGNIILRFTDLQNDRTSLRTGLVEETGIITSAYTCIMPSENSKYVAYLLHSYDTLKIFYGLGGGVRQSISFKDVRYLNVPVPPREEQDQIVRFLDWKVSGINKLVNLRKRQINHCREYMKGEIETQLFSLPCLKTIRLRHLGTFFKGGGFSRANLVDDGYPAVLYGDIYTQYEYKTSAINHFIDKSAYDSSRKILKSDIMMAGTGETKDEIGKAILYTGDQAVAIGGDIIVFRPNDDINPEFLLYHLYSQSSLKHRYINSRGDIIVHIYPLELGNTLISLPSPQDQTRIVERINYSIMQVKKWISILEDEIKTLKEYKTRLIADVVTGKIDVRGIDIPEYETVEEIEEDFDEDLDDEFIMEEEED
jgi:type I restriction enzyme S subunit